MSGIMVEEEQKRCTRCGVEHPLSFFRKHRVYHGYVVHHSICKECEIKERKAKREENPFRPKARATLTYHARQEKMGTKQFSHKFGIPLDYIEMLFRDAWLLHEAHGKCHSCFHPFEGTLDDFHLDKIDPKRPPTRSNVRVICRTCNNSKGSKDPTEYDLEAIEYDRNKEAVKRGVQISLPDEKPKAVPRKGKRAINRASEQLELFNLN